MATDLTGHVLPKCFDLFRWQAFAGQSIRDVTCFYAITPPAGRLRGRSSVLYIGQTTNAIDARYRQETETNNTLGNTQATNIRTSHVFRAIRARGDRIELYFTEGISFRLPKERVDQYGQLLEIWNKNHYVKHFKPNPDGSLDLEIERFLLSHCADEHLEVPPPNNRAG
jgi:hypothetical protein